MTEGLILIGRKSALPDKCPCCGNEADAYLKKGINFTNMIAYLFDGFMAVPREVWPGYIQWFATCKRCHFKDPNAKPFATLLAESMKQGSLFDRVESRNDFRGGTFKIPFGGG